MNCGECPPAGASVNARVRAAVRVIVRRLLGQELGAQPAHLAEELHHVERLSPRRTHDSAI